jgi:hypothetical protein
MEPRFPEMFENPKLIFGKTSGVIIDLENLWCDQSGRVAVPFHYLQHCYASSVVEQLRQGSLLDSNKYDLMYLLIIARSTIGKWHFEHLSTDTRDKTPDAIKRLPVPRIAFITPEIRRAALAQEARAFAAAENTVGLLAFTAQRLAAQPEESDVVHDLLAYLAQQMIEMNKQKQAEMKRFLGWLEGVLRIQPDKKGNTGLDALTGKSRLRSYLGDYQKGEAELPFDELRDILFKNRTLLGVSLNEARFMAKLQEEYEKSLAVLLPIKEKLRWTDELIDQIVYRLYGLTEEEIAIVEGRK